MVLHHNLLKSWSSTVLSSLLLAHVLLCLSKIVRHLPPLTRTHTCTHTHMHAHTRTHTHTHTHMHAHTHTHTLTHTGDSANIPLLPPLAADYCSDGWYHGVLCAGRTQVRGAGSHGKDERLLCMLPLHWQKYVGVYTTSSDANVTCS